MPGKGSAVFGLYLDFAGLRGCIDCLKAIGIKSSDVSLLLPDGSILSTLSLGIDPRAILASKRRNSMEKQECADGAKNGALAKSLFSLGVPGYEQERYETRIRNGATLIAVRCVSPVWPEDIYEIFTQTAAVGISSMIDERVVPHSLARPNISARPPYHQDKPVAHSSQSERASITLS